MHCHTLNGQDSWCDIKLLKCAIRPTHYTIRSYPTGSGATPLNWVLEAKRLDDSGTWVTLSEHKNCRDIVRMGQSKTYALECEGDDYYRHFRVRTIGKTVKGDYYLCVSGFELYGEAVGLTENGTVAAHEADEEATENISCQPCAPNEEEIMMLNAINPD